MGNACQMSFICTNTSVCTQKFAVIICTVTLVPSAKRTVCGGLLETARRHFLPQRRRKCSTQLYVSSMAGCGFSCRAVGKQIQFACHNSTMLHPLVRRMQHVPSRASPPRLLHCHPEQRRTPVYVRYLNHPLHQAQCLSYIQLCMS